MDKNLLEKTVKNSSTITEVCFKIYGNKYYGNRQTIKKYIEKFNLNIKHFGINFSNNRSNRFNKTPLSKIMISGSTYDTTNLKKRLYSEGLKVQICEKCGQDEWWYGEKISLILDHINGDNRDHRIENLRILCPNCNATLPTHCGKNIKHKRKNKKTKIDVSIMNRKVTRPPYEQLKKEVSELGYSATGRKYGVSDNAIRKWIRFYMKHNLLL